MNDTIHYLDLIEISKTLYNQQLQNTNYFQEHVVH